MFDYLLGLPRLEELETLNLFLMTAFHHQYERSDQVDCTFQY